MNIGTLVKKLEFKGEYGFSILTEYLQDLNQ